VARQAPASHLPAALIGTWRGQLQPTTAGDSSVSITVNLGPTDQRRARGQRVRVRPWRRRRRRPDRHETLTMVTEKAPGCLPAGTVRIAAQGGAGHDPAQLVPTGQGRPGPDDRLGPAPRLNWLTRLNRNAVLFGARQLGSSAARRGGPPWLGPISPAPVTQWRPGYLPAYLSNGVIGLRVGHIPLFYGV